ncbi:MAG TPA: hypothetical protein VNK43_10490 [Gemmatimonadales bacterium]|nr:hypothetical protein [Gemmatimonadales bacterium]
MPTRTTVRKAKRALRRGKRPTTAAGEFVREEIEHVRRGKHGARSTRQAIAIGLSKARRAGVPVRPPRKGEASEGSRRSAERDYEVGQGKRKPQAPSRKRSRAVRKALERESRTTASTGALSRHAKRAATRRAATQRAATRRDATRRDATRRGGNRSRRPR